MRGRGQDERQDGGLGIQPYNLYIVRLVWLEDGEAPSCSTVDSPPQCPACSLWESTLPSVTDCADNEGKGERRHYIGH